MNKPTRKWKCIRSAVLERARRTAIEPLETLFTVHAAVCIYYFVGALRFQLFDHSAAFTLIESIQLLTVAVAGVLVPILTGSVLTLHIASRRLQSLERE
jgi:hypothetical protein